MGKYVLFCLFVFLLLHVPVNSYGHVGAVASDFVRLKTPVVFYIIDRSKAVLLIWYSVFACFCVSFCTVFSFCASVPGHSLSLTFSTRH